MDKYYNPWIYPITVYGYELINDYEIITQLTNGNRYRQVIVERSVASFPLQALSPSDIVVDAEFEAVERYAEQIWGDRVDPIWD